MVPVEGDNLMTLVPQAPRSTKKNTSLEENHPLHKKNCLISNFYFLKLLDFEPHTNDVNTSYQDSSWPTWAPSENLTIFCWIVAWVIQLATNTVQHGMWFGNWSILQWGSTQICQKTFVYKHQIIVSYILSSTLRRPVKWSSGSRGIKRHQKAFDLLKQSYSWLLLRVHADNGLHGYGKQLVWCDGICSKPLARLSGEWITRRSGNHEVQNHWIAWIAARRLPFVKQTGFPTKLTFNTAKHVFECSCFAVLQKHVSKISPKLWRRHDLVGKFQGLATAIAAMAISSLGWMSMCQKSRSNISIKTLLCSFIF